jgi:hypothetical protein
MVSEGEGPPGGDTLTHSTHHNNDAGIYSQLLTA